MEYSLEERSRYIEFWLNLSKAERRELNFVTEDLPLDRAAGLMNVKNKLWTGWIHLLNFTILCFRMALNVMTTVHNVRDAWHADMVTVGGFDTSSHTDLMESFVRFCEDNALPQDNEGMHGGESCMTFELSRLKAYRLIMTVECCIVVLAASTTFLCGLCFVVCGAVGLPQRRPYFFFFVPKMGAKFSSISFLQFLNMARFRSLIFRGEGRLFATLAWESLCRRKPTDAEMDMDSSRREEGGACSVLAHGVASVLTLMLIFASFQALLVKMTVVHFAAVRNFSDWTVMQWILFAGFMNQLAGMCLVEELELHRLLLLKFTTARLGWGPNQCRHCVAYFRLLARKIAEGKLGQESRLKAFATMCLLDSHDFQKLLLCTARESQTVASRGPRLKLNEAMFVTHGEHFMKQLQALKNQPIDEEYYVKKVQAAYRAYCVRKKLYESEREGYSRLRRSSKQRKGRMLEMLDVEGPRVSCRDVGSASSKSAMPWVDVVKTAKVVVPRLDFMCHQRDALLRLVHRPRGGRVLTIAIRGARGLRNADNRVAGTSDPYCVCEILGRKRGSGPVIKTAVIPDTLNPTWNYEAEISDYLTNERLMFTVWDSDLGKRDDLLGTITVDTSEFYPNGFQGELQLEEAGKPNKAYLSIALSLGLPAKGEDGSLIEQDAVAPSAGLLLAAQLQEHIEDLEVGMKGHFPEEAQRWQSFRNRGEGPLACVPSFGLASPCGYHRISD